MKKVIIISFSLFLFLPLLYAQESTDRILGDINTGNNNPSLKIKILTEFTVGFAVTGITTLIINKDNKSNNEYLIPALLGITGPIIVGRSIYKDKGNILNCVFGDFLGIILVQAISGGIGPKLYSTSKNDHLVSKNTSKFLIMIVPPFLATLGYNIDQLAGRNEATAFLDRKGNIHFSMPKVYFQINPNDCKSVVNPKKQDIFKLHFV